MAEYCLDIFGVFGRFPGQVLLGLRKLAGDVKEEMNATPIQIDLMETR